MDRALLTAILVLCVSQSREVTVFPGVDFRCPSDYNVQIFDKKVVQFKVSDDKKDCDRLVGKTDVKQVNKEIQPYIKIVYIDGEYRASIFWDMTLTGDKLPRIFLLNLTFYDIADLDSPKYFNHSCVLLRLVGNRKIQTEMVPVTAKFQFDCLPLLEQDNIGLVVKLWSFSKQKGQRCRSLRSMQQEEGKCGSDVQCSQNYSFPISKNDHKYMQCACYVRYHGYPKLDWYYDYGQEAFQINLTNIPPYLYLAEMDVVDDMKDSILTNISVYYVKKNDISVTSKVFHPGQYTVYVRVKLKLSMECDKHGWSSYIDDICDYDAPLYVQFSSQKLNVTLKDEKTDIPENTQALVQGRDDESSNTLFTVLGIMGSVVCISIVTALVFIVCKRWQNERNTRARTESCAHQSEESYRIVNDPNNIVEMSPLNHDSWLLIEASQQSNVQTEDTETAFLQRNIQPETGMPPVQNQPGVCQCADDRPAATAVKSAKHKVMLLYHPDANNKSHVQRVKTFSQALTDKYGIVVQSKTAGNWKDFAESAFVTFENVVLIISEDLRTLCHHYFHSETIPPGILNERYQEIIPCIVLKKLQTLMQQEAGGKNIFIHIVTLDNQTEILHQFLYDHPFLTSENTYQYVYDLCSNELALHSIDLTSLVNRLKPVSENSIPNDIQQMMMELNST